MVQVSSSPVLATTAVISRTKLDGAEAEHATIAADTEAEPRRWLSGATAGVQ